MLKIGIVNVNEREGGRRTFVHDFAKALAKKGCDARIIDLQTFSWNALNSFDILHFSDHYFGVYTWKLLFAYRPRKVLTVHGSVKKEIIHMLKKGKPDLKTALGGFLSLAIWNIAPLFFNALTCPSKRVVNENNLKNALVIHNAIFPEDYKNVESIDIRETRNEIVFVTYSSLGGLLRNLDKIVQVVGRLNRMLKEQKVILLIFGTKLYQNINSDAVRFMGYSADFLRFLKGSDLYLAGHTTTDFGYVTMESAALGIPVAKFTNKYEDEEIVDGQTGILAVNEQEIVQKLLMYIENIDRLKPRLGSGLSEYVNRTKSWDSVILEWQKLFSTLLRK